MRYYILFVIISAIGGIISFIANDVDWFYTWVGCGALLAVTEFFGDSVKNQEEQNKYLKNINNNIAKIITKLESNE